MKHLIRILVLLAAAWGGIRVYAQPVKDALILKNGRTFVGILVSSTDDSVRIQIEDGTVLAFHLKEVVARTKETVLPTYVPIEERMEPYLVLAPGIGKGANNLYGTAFGCWIAQTLSSGFFVGAHIAVHGGTSREFSFAVTKLVSVDPPQAVTVYADVLEKTKGLMVFLVAGKDILWRWSSTVRPYIGFGIARLTSDVTYLKGKIPSGENLEGDVPLQGTRNHGYVSAGVVLSIVFFDNWYFQPEVRYNGSLVDFGGQFNDRTRDLTFIEGNNSSFLILFSIGFRLN